LFIKSGMNSLDLFSYHLLSHYGAACLVCEHFGNLVVLVCEFGRGLS